MTQDCLKCIHSEDCRFYSDYFMCNYKMEMMPKFQSKSQDKCRQYKQRVEVVEVKKKGRR